VKPGSAVGRRREDHQLALDARAGPLVGALPVAGPAHLGERRQRGPLHPARAALGHGQHPCAPVALLGHVRARPDNDHARPAAHLAAELPRPRHDVLAVGKPPPEQVLEEVTDGGLGGPLRRLGAVDLEADQVRHQAQQRPGRRLTARPVAQLSDLLLGHPQLDALRAALAGHHGALVLARGARHGQHAAGGVQHDHARVERAAGGPGYLGQAGAGLDGL
jgi:hypothetical protein